MAAKRESVARMPCRSTNCIALPLLCAQFCCDLLRRALGSSLAVEPGYARVDDGHQIGDEVLLVVLRQVHDRNGPPLRLEQRLQVREAKARESVPMLDHH